jgi:hypothetical protein
MQVGLLWYDGDPARGVATKAVEAARRYREKFGVAPDTCYVHRAAIAGVDTVVPLQDGASSVLRLRPAANILPNHFWVGVEDAVSRLP